MESISLPFSASYGATSQDAIGNDRITVTGGAVIVIGNSPASVEVRGIVRVTQDSLEVEYRATRAQVMGLVSSPQDTSLHSVSIPLAAVDSIRMKGGIFRKPRMIIAFNRLDAVPALPWSDTTHLTLVIERADRQRARELVVNTSNSLADADLKRLGEHPG